MAPTKTRENVGADMDRYVGTRVRARRQQVGISALALSKDLDLPRQSVDKWENGQARMSAGQIYTVAVLLGVHPGWFFEGHPVSNLTDHRPTDLDLVLQMPDAVPMLMTYAKLDENARAAAMVLMTAAAGDREPTLDGKDKPLVAPVRAGETDDADDEPGNG